MKQTELLAIGGAYVDINCPEFPFDESGIGIETEIVGGGYEFELGGSAVNFARLCSSLDLYTTFIGKVGKDVLGGMLSELLVKAQVQPELIVDNNVATNLSFNMVNPNGKTIMAVVGSANQSLTPQEVYDRASKVLEGSTYMFVGGCFKLKSLMPAFERLALEAKDSGTKVVLDHARLNGGVTEEEKEVVRRLALVADYYLPSKDEFMQLWNASSISEGLQQLKGKLTGTIVVKDGEHGAVTIIDGEIITIPAFEVQPIHTVGAGDSFDAGFIAAQSKNQDLISSIRFGCATAALKISQRTLPSYESVEEFIRQCVKQ